MKEVLIEKLKEGRQEGREVWMEGEKWREAILIPLGITNNTKTNWRLSTKLKEISAYQ